MMARSLTNDEEVSLSCRPRYFDRSFASLFTSVEACRKCWHNAGKFCQAALTVRKLDAVMTPAESGSAAASDEQEEEEGSRRRSTSQVVHRNIAALDTLALLAVCLSQ